MCARRATIAGRQKAPVRADLSNIRDAPCCLSVLPPYSACVQRNEKEVIQWSAFLRRRQDLCLREFMQEQPPHRKTLNTEVGTQR